jgi:hypothetical protein
MARLITVWAAVNLPDLPYGDVVEVDMDDPQTLSHILVGLLVPVEPVAMTDDEKPPKLRKKPDEASTEPDASAPS